MNDYVIKKIEQELKDYAVDAGTIQDIVTLLNNETPDVVARRNSLKNILWDISNKYLSNMFLDWQREAGLVPLPYKFSDPIKEKTLSVLNEYIDYIVEVEKQKKGVKND